MKDSNSRGLGWEDWLVALGRAGLSVERRKRHEITIRWFLGWCRRQRPLVEPTREEPRRFYLEKVRERNAPLVSDRRGLPGLVSAIGTAVSGAEPGSLERLGGEGIFDRIGSGRWRFGRHAKRGIQCVALLVSGGI